MKLTQTTLIGFVMVTYCSFTSCSTANGDEKDWNTHIVIEEQGFNVRCKVRKQITMIEPDWLSLEFENKTDKPLHIKTVDFRFRYEQTANATKRKLASGELWRGGFQELLKDILDPVPGEGGILPARSMRTQTEQLTEVASAHAGTFAPTPAGDHMQIFLLFHVEFADGRTINSTTLDVPIDTELLPLDKDTLVLARKRLRYLLLHPREDLHQHLLIRHLLNSKGVSSDLTAEEIVKGIRMRHYDTGSPGVLLEFAKEWFPNDPVWLKYQADISKGQQVAGNGKLWDKSCVEPVVMVYESFLHPLGHCLSLLDQHREDWIANKDICKRLSQATLSRWPMLNKKLEYLNNDEKEKWTWGVRELSKCGDHSVIPLMRKGLDDKTVVHDIRRFANSMFSNPPPTLRVCDESLRAILALLQDDIQTACRQAGYTSIINPRNHLEVEKKINLVHDKMIAELKARLDQPKK